MTQLVPQESDLHWNRQMWLARRFQSGSLVFGAGDERV
jgi:hypothetical protein